MARLNCLVWSGIGLYCVLYIFQAIFLLSYTTEHVNILLWILVGLYLPSLVFLSCFGCFLPSAMHVKSVQYVWIVWLLYIIAFVPTVAVIFTEVVPDLSISERLGPNVLKTLLCITPVLLILLLNVTIAPVNRRFVERVSITVALDLFDGIEMLAIILEQKGRAFDLDGSIEAAILIFVCISFVLSPFALFQHKVRFGEVTVRKKTMVIRTSVQVLLVNLAFLVMRFIVWFHYDYDASIFITKNIIAIVISGIDICAVFNYFSCGAESNETFHI